MPEVGAFCKSCRSLPFAPDRGMIGLTRIMTTRARRVLIARSILAAGIVFLSLGYFLAADISGISREINATGLQAAPILLSSLITLLILFLGFQFWRVGRPGSLLEAEPATGPKKSALREYFFEPPRSKMAGSPLFKYGMLGLIGALLAFQIWWLFRLPPGYPYDRYLGLITVTMLLLNHLSMFFYFGPRFTFPFRLFSAAFVVFGCVFAFGSLWNLF